MKLGIETERIEFKKSTAELHKAIESIAAILNKHGNGEVYFGVSDNGEVIGQIISYTTIRAISDAIIRDIEPRITPTIDIITYEDKSVIKVAFYGSQKPYSAFGRFLIRVGTSNRQMTRDELRRLIKNEDYSYPWEKEITSYTLDDIDDLALRKYYDEAVNCGRLNLNNYDKEALLVLLELYKDNHLNNAGFALFGKEANISLKLACFATNEKITFTDLNSIKGNIYTLISTAVTYVLNHINWRIEINTKRVETPEIPIQAIREIIVNAFAHAIYEPTPEIEINIHPNKITFFNPGSFPEDLTPSDFINRNISSIKRNPLILDILYRCKDVEKSGTGFKRMNELCKSENISWDSNQSAYGFLFTFYRDNNPIRTTLENKDLTTNEEIVLNIIKNNPKITRENIAEQLKISTRTVQRITNSLANKNKLIRVKSNRFGYWEIVK